MKPRKRRREKVVEDVGRYWVPDQKAKAIRTKDLTGWRRYYLRWFKRFTMKELYTWIKTNWAGAELIVHEFPLKTDNTRLSKELERKVSRIYQLQGGWIIRDEDKKYFRRGPLISQDGRMIEVAEHGWIAGVFLWLEKYRPIIGPLTLIATLVLLLLRTAGVI